MASACVYIECPITNMILAVSRKDDPEDFGLPGGKVEPFEFEITAAIRELQEETGIVAHERRMTEIFRRSGGVTYELNLFDISHVQPRKNGETGVIAWVTPERLMAGCFGEYNKMLLEHIGRI